MLDGGPYPGVVVEKQGYSGTPVPAANITYTIKVNIPGQSPLTIGPGAKPHTWRPPPPRITEGRQRTICTSGR